MTLEEFIKEQKVEGLIGRVGENLTRFDLGQAIKEVGRHRRRIIRRILFPKEWRAQLLEKEQVVNENLEYGSAKNILAWAQSLDDKWRGQNSPESVENIPRPSYSREAFWEWFERAVPFTYDYYMPGRLRQLESAYCFKPAVQRKIKKYEQATGAPKFNLFYEFD